MNLPGFTAEAALNRSGTRRGGGILKKLPSYARR